MTKKKEIPTHTIDGLKLSEWGRISAYAQDELDSISVGLMFYDINDKDELFKRLNAMITKITKI